MAGSCRFTASRKHPAPGVASAWRHADLCRVVDREVLPNLVRPTSLNVGDPTPLGASGVTYVSLAVAVSLTSLAPAVCAAPALVVESISQAPAVSHSAPASVKEYISAASAVFAASVSGVEYMSPAPAVSYAASAPENYATPALWVGSFSPAPPVSSVLPTPTVYAAAAPLVEYGGPAPVVSYAAPAPVQYAPTLLHAAPVQWPVSTTTVTRGGNLQGWPSRCTPETSGWSCCAAAMWSATASLSSRGFDLLASPPLVRACVFPARH